MALRTLGTNATTSLNALLYAASLPAADVASLALSIKDDVNVTHPVFTGAFVLGGSQGQLYVPNRGMLIVNPGDFVGVDSRGWPILLSADTIANGPWTHS